MAQTRKSIIDEAFMEAESIEQAFKANSKEILAHTMGSEIEEMVKESLGSIGLNEDEDEENVDLELDLDSEDDAGLAAGDDLDLGDEDDEDEDFDLSDFEDGGEGNLDVVDLTREDDETVVNVFKKMSDNDEIEVVQTGDGVEIKDNVTGAEYKIELGGGTSELEDEDEFDLEDEDEFDLEDEVDIDLSNPEDEDDFNEVEEGTIYEIVLDEDDLNEIGAAQGEHSAGGMDRETYCLLYPEECMGEGSMEDGMTEDLAGTRGYRGMKGRRHSAVTRQPRTTNENTTPKFLKLVNENKVLKSKISSIVSENETLKEDYNKMVDALKEFRQKLNEVAVFNSNLTYTVRLFTEHSTTKDEKVDIIKRFDEAKSLKESKNVYKNLVKEISKTKAPLKESIEEKLNETKSSGSATEITESKVYVDPQIEKMKKLWSYDYKK